MNAIYLSAAETAKLIRGALKRSFPGVKFSVRSKTYSGGASINVDWTDGPTDRMVAAVTGQFAGGRFDGSIDLKIGVSHWLKPDGTAVVASSQGTEGSLGCIPAQREWMPEPDCKLVHFCADFVFTNRKLSPQLADRILAAAVRKWGKLDVTTHVSTYDGSAHFQGGWDDERRVHEIASRFMSVRG